MTNKNSVLFVCTANRYRSPFAEAFFRCKLEEDGIAQNWQVSSAGTWTKNGLPAVPQAVYKAKELGLDLSEHRSLEVTQELLLAQQIVLVMEKGHQESLWAEFPKACKRILLLSDVTIGASYDLPDPARYPEEAEQIMDELQSLLERGYQNIVEKTLVLAENNEE